MTNTYFCVYICRNTHKHTPVQWVKTGCEGVLQGLVYQWGAQGDKVVPLSSHEVCRYSHTWTNMHSHKDEEKMMMMMTINGVISLDFTHTQIHKI